MIPIRAGSTLLAQVRGGRADPPVAALVQRLRDIGTNAGTERLLITMPSLHGSKHAEQGAFFVRVSYAGDEPQVATARAAALRIPGFRDVRELPA